jgi:hypothetical protein
MRLGGDANVLAAFSRKSQLACTGGPINGYAVHTDAKSRSVERIMRCASRLLRRMPDRKRTKSPRRRRSRLSGLGTRSGLTRGRAAELKRKNGATSGVVCGAKTPRRKNLPDNAAWRTTAPPICGRPSPTIDDAGRPLYPQKRTLPAATEMSANCQ